MAAMDFIADTILNDPLLTKTAVLTIGAAVTIDEVLFYSKSDVAKRTGLMYEEVQPEIHARNSFTENAAQDNSVVIDDTTYYLDAKEPLRNGLTKWTLKSNPVRRS